MAEKCQTIINLLESLAPKKLAEEWDNVGLQVGDPARDVAKVMVALDITPEVVAEAIAEKVDLIIAHHPLLFKPVKNLRYDLPGGKLLRELIIHDIGVYTSHTNLDSAKPGLNDWLAGKLGLEKTEVLAPGYTEQLYKMVIFVPQGHEEAVLNALGSAGAGWIGNYSHCTFNTPGTGTFKPLSGANPYIGQVGELEKVAEYRMETIVPESRLQKAVRAMLKVHPYEEVAYDIYPLENRGQQYGLGRFGYLPQEVALVNLAEKVKDVLGTEFVRVAGQPNRMIKKAAVCGGSGASLINKAAFYGVDVLITGDVKYHEAREAELLGLAVIDAGHFATEKLAVPYLVQYLQDKIAEHKLKLEVIGSQAERDVFWKR